MASRDRCAMHSKSTPICQAGRRARDIIARRFRVDHTIRVLATQSFGGGGNDLALALCENEVMRQGNPNGAV
jgi:hypothetical protein